MARTKRTPAQKRAYDTGRAYRLGRDKIIIEFKNPENKKSFSDGFKAGGKTKYKNVKTR